MKPLAWVLVVVVGLGAGYCWHRQSVRTAVQMAQTEASRDSLRLAEQTDSILRAIRDSAKAVRDSAKKAWAADTAQKVRQIVTLRRQNTDWRDSAAALDSAYQAVLASLPDSARAPIQGNVRALTFQLSTCTAGWHLSDSLFHGCAQRLAASDSSLAAADSSIAELKRMQARTAALADQYRRAARPSWLKQVANALPWMAGAFATGILVMAVAK